MLDFVIEDVCEVAGLTDVVADTDSELLFVFDCAGDNDDDTLRDAEFDELTPDDAVAIAVGVREFVCDIETDMLFVKDFDTDGVIVGEAATDEDADGQPKPRVHVGLDENDVPNDCVVV